MTKMSVFPKWNKILIIWDTLFELTHIEVRCNKNYFKMFLPQEPGAFGNNRKGTTKATPIIVQISILYIYRLYFLYLQSNASGSFFQKCINFVEQRLKFSHLKVKFSLPCNVIQNVFRGKAAPSRAKNQQSIGIKSFYSNTSYSLEYEKTASVNNLLKRWQKTKAVKAYAYRMLLSFKMSATYNFFLTSHRTIFTHIL